MRQGRIQFSDDADVSAHLAECQAALDDALAWTLAQLPSNAERAERLQAMEHRRGSAATDRIRSLTWGHMRNAA
jgi:hypothetical protein